MPLQNRVDPFGGLFATSARGTMFGNRGGKFHTGDRGLTSRRWVSRQWICCVLDFKGRRRDVWGRYYTELFFLDEVTAFAAGHRPCFECRRKDAKEFAARFPLKGKVTALAMDDMLHAERLNGKAKRIHRRNIDMLPDGAMIARDGEAYAVRGGKLLRWTPRGYKDATRRPKCVSVDVLTPPSMLKVLSRGYAPQWHPTSVIPDATKRRSGIHRATKRS
jgi:hypothetical protein